MSAVYILGIVKALVVHTHIDSKDIGKINSTVHASLIRADDHKVLIVNVKSLLVLQKSFDKLVRRMHSLKSVKRCSVLDLRVMCIEGDDVLNTHIDKFMEGSSTVK